MTEERNKTEARQGDRRRTNMTALIAGMIAIVAIFIAIILLSR